MAIHENGNPWLKKGCFIGSKSRSFHFKILKLVVLVSSSARLGEIVLVKNLNSPSIGNNGRQLALHCQSISFLGDLEITQTPQ
jgi:hypothetical protein